MVRFDRFALFVGAVCCSLVAACNKTDGNCWPPGQGGAGPGSGAGGGIITPGQGGFGDVPPKPQGAPGDGADPCNVAEAKAFYCNGDVLCHIPMGSAVEGCHHNNTKVFGTSAGQVIEDLVSECQADHPGYSCEQSTLSCTDKLAPVVQANVYSCTGPVTCTDKKGYTDSCVYNKEEVWADSDEEARDHLTEMCEVIMHDKYGNNCANGGMCCTPGSLNCVKKK